VKTFLILFLAIVAEVVATSALKASEGFTRLVPSLIVVAGYGIAFTCLSLTLKTIPLGVAYAIWSGIGTALVAVVGWLYFKQHLDLPVVLGIGLIVSGTIVLNLFSKISVH
jgi:small multidrug resistance pump